MDGLSRRGFVGLGTLAGAGALAAAGGSPADAAPLAHTFTVHAERLRDLTPKDTVIGGGTAARGALVDARGAAVGDLIVSGTRLSHRGDTTDLAAHENQLLVLPQGTLAGTGTVTRGGEGSFVVTGGTGAYAGARGSYTTTQVADRHGSGSAVVRVELVL